MFRFTIRDLLWLMLVVALGVGWVQTSRRLASVEAKYRPLQATFDAMKAQAARAKMDEQFRNSYDGPQRSARQPR